MEGFITITGGKLMTYRLMAEWATDAVCRKLGNTDLRDGRTAAARLAAVHRKTLQKIISCPRRCAVRRLPPRRQHATWLVKDA
jgi:glycerol-3-phosphate dehydrogenase